MNDAPDSSFGASSFLADMAGMFAQHAVMWSVYIESLKILVSVTSLPLVAAAALLALAKPDVAANTVIAQVITINQFPVVIFGALLIVCVVDLLLLGVVIHHRLAVLFYARGLNGYRQIYLQRWNAALPAEQQLSIAHYPFPTDSSYPQSYERWGPMGLIVHASALINALYAFAAFKAIDRPALNSTLAATVVFLGYEAWYLMSCRNRR